jgi:hypothetical protein
VVHLSAEYCRSVAQGKSEKDWVTEITGELVLSNFTALNRLAGVILHELVHTVQHDGHGQVPGGLIEGMADYIRLQAGLGAAHWDDKSAGHDWDCGYE